MKKNEVKVGGTYVAKVSDKLVNVRIDSTHSGGGWNATNRATGKRIRIKSARRLRGVAAARGKKAETTEAAVANDEKVEEPVVAACLRAPHRQATKKTKFRKKTGAKTGAKTTDESGVKKAGGKQRPKRVSALDAAAQVLAKAGKPMRVQELIAAMAEQGLWSSPAGKTPSSTLYASILREARDKGAASRFRKVDRGLFAFNKAGA